MHGIVSICANSRVSEIGVDKKNDFPFEADHKLNDFGVHPDPFEDPPFSEGCAYQHDVPAIL